MSRQGKKRNRNFQNVKNFWEHEASEWGDDPRVTIRDHFFRILVKDEIVKHLKEHKKAIDIGCGTGFSSLYYAEIVKKLLAVDYSPEMIKKANKYLSNETYFQSTMKQYAIDRTPSYEKIVKNLRFAVGDILDLTFPTNSFDVAVTERVVVNLPTRVQQRKAVKQVNKVLEKHGLWLLAEASIQGNKNMNRIRKKFGLEKLERYWHNLYIDEPWFEKTLEKSGFSIKAIKRFETYQFLTRVVHPLVIFPKDPEFMSGFNNAARIISAKYPEYKDVKKVGAHTFFKNKFRLLLKKYDFDKIRNYDEVIENVLKINPNFSLLGNHIFYILEKTK